MNIIFTLSIWGSLLALLVLIIELFTKNKFYKTLQYYMWLIVLIRFIVPFFPEITLKTTTTLQHTIIPQQVNVNQEMLTPVNIDNNYEVSEQDIVVKNKVNILKLIKDYIGVIYFIGFILVTILNILVYINFKIKVFKYNINVNYNENYTFVFNRCKYQAKIKRKINLFLNSYISTPMLIGIFKPTVLS